MEVTTTYRIRPHHGMCLYFFEGKGYSEGFTKHMAEVKEWLLGKNGPASLRLVGTTDEICSACPHNKGGSCESAEKVERYDAGVLKYTGLKAGQDRGREDSAAGIWQGHLWRLPVERYLPQIMKSIPMRECSFVLHEI